MKRALAPIIIVGLIVGIVLSITAYFFQISSARYNSSMTALELKSLQTQETWLSTGATPKSVNLAIGVSESGLSKLFKSLEGVKAASESVDGVALEVARTQVEIKPGYIQLLLSIRAYQEGTPVAVTLNARGVLLVDGIEVGTDESEVSHAHYRIGIREVSTELNMGLLSFRTFKLINEVMASHVAKKFSESLRFSLPIRIPMNLDIGVSRTTTEKTEHGEFAIRYTMANSDLSSDATLQIIPSIPAHDALWFFVLAETDGGAIVPTEETPQEKEVSVARIEEMRSRVAAMVKQFPSFDSDVAVYANPQFFQTALDAFNELTDKQRRIDARLVSRTGDLVKNYDNVDIVGKGGYSVQLRDGNSLSGWGRIPRLTPTWIEDSGLTLSGDMPVSASAKLRLHIDPYITGGFHTNVNVDGSATLPLRVRIDARQISLEDGTSAAIIGPVIECVRFPVKLESGGDIKLGIITYEFLGKSQLSPQVLMSSDVLWTQLAEKGRGGMLRFEDDHWIEFRIVPETIVSGTGGYQFFARMESSLIRGEKPESARNLARRNSIRESWKKTVQTRCPGNKPSEFLFAGEKFGPNNIIVKAINVAGASFELSGEVMDLPWDIIETVVKNPKDTPKVLEKELKIILKKAEKVVKKIRLKKAEKGVKKIINSLGL